VFNSVHVSWKYLLESNKGGSKLVKNSYVLSHGMFSGWHFIRGNLSAWRFVRWHLFSALFIGHSIFTGLRPYEDQKIENNVKLRRQYARRLRAMQSHPKRIRIVIPMVVVKVIVVVVD